MVGHRTPRVVSRCRLREPDVTGVSGELSAFECSHDGISVADLPPGGVDYVSASLHRRDELVVEEMLRLGMKRRVDRDDVAIRDHRGRGLVEGETQLLLHLCRKSVTVGVMQLDVERLQAPQDSEADPAGCDGPDGHAFDVIRPLDAIGDVPTAVDDPLVRRNVVANERQDHHHDVLRDADAVRVRDLDHRDSSVDRRLNVDVVRSDSGGDRELEVPCLGDPLSGQVRRPEWLGDHDVRVHEFPVEGRIDSVLVGGHDKSVASALEEAA